MSVYLCFVGLVLAADTPNFPKDKELRCTACEVITSYLDHVLNQVDASKTYTIDSSHNNPKKVKNNQIGLKMSETRLTEVLDTLCESMPERQALAWHNKKWKFIFDEDADEGLAKDKYTATKMFKYIVDKHLKRICHRLLSDHEADIVDYLFGNYADDLNLRNKICHKIAGYCPKTSPRKLNPNRKIASTLTARPKSAVPPGTEITEKLQQEIAEEKQQIQKKAKAETSRKKNEL